MTEAKLRDCPVCDSKDIFPFTKKNGYSFSKCTNCDLVYINPELDQQDLEPLYNELGAPEDGLRYPYNKVEHRRKRTAYRTKRFKKYIVGKDVMDFGCGGGYMVDAMMNAGAKSATGVDLDPESIEFAKSNHNPQAIFHCGRVEDYIADGKQFDFGHSSQVIEHVGDFNSFVESWAKAIKSGGYFFLKTPDRLHWRTGRNPDTWPTPPHYTQYFSKKNIKLLLEKHGFEVEKMFFNWKPAMEILARRK